MELCIIVFQMHLHVLPALCPNICGLRNSKYRKCDIQRSKGNDFGIVETNRLKLVYTHSLCVSTGKM